MLALVVTAPAFEETCHHTLVGKAAQVAGRGDVQKVLGRGGHYSVVGKVPNRRYEGPVATCKEENV